MKLDHQNSEYAAYVSQWQRCRDAAEGQDAVHARGEAYLPRLSGQTDIDYAKYRNRASFFNATGRTADAFVGMIFAKQHTVTVPQAIQAYLNDITLSGCSLRDFAVSIVSEQMCVGRVGIAVDFPSIDDDPVTVAVSESLNQRPYLRMYTAENIVDWRMGEVNGAQALTMVKLHEMIDVATDDEFVTASIEQYRVLDLFEGAYRVRLFRRDDSDKWVVVSEAYPLASGRLLNFVPFVIANVQKTGAVVEKPPMLDLADTNLAHYRNTADYEHGLHFTGLPTPVICGVQLEPGQKLGIGSTTAWVFPDPAAKASFLEFTGTGLSALFEAIKAKEHRMAVLGARMLADEKKAAESTESNQIRAAGEHGALSSIALCASEAIKKALEMVVLWAGANGEVEFKLNTDFGARRINAQELTALVAAWQSGAISKESLFANLQGGGVVRDGLTFEDEQARIDDAAPQLAQGNEPAEQPTGLMQRLTAVLNGLGR